ncbi:MAG: hypothetical protein WA840_18630 [Caulobacteraceae bacterium]
MSFRLASPLDATADIARLFLGHAEAVIAVKEDKCFGPDGYWTLGNVTLDSDGLTVDALAGSIRRGAFEWTIRPYDEALAELKTLLKIGEPPEKNKDPYERTIARLDRIMDSAATSGVRTGLIHPIFDSRSVENMPFRQGTTVIADTSGVLQGGLSFVSTFLHPAARIKIPAVVHMEVVNQADNFLKRRRAPKTNTSALLLDHMVSQAGQRALLRLELSPETEVERSLLVGDPLRNAFQRDTDNEWIDLQLSVPLRSYCDRLILEAARQHQSQTNPGHRLTLLTSDQGFARMALAEGIAPLYFRAVDGHSFFGQTLTGTKFHPLRGRLHQVGLQEVLWELATAFGAVKIATLDGSRTVEIAAFGEDLTWSPVHSHNDLLWIRDTGLPSEPATTQPSLPGPMKLAALPDAPTAKVPKSVKRAVTKFELEPKPAQPAFYRFNVERMFNLVLKLVEEGELTDARAQSISEAKDDRGFSEFRRFLLTGKLAVHTNGLLQPTEAGIALAASVRDVDPDRFSVDLRNVPSVCSFFDHLEAAAISQPITLELPPRADTTYKALGEVSLLGTPIPGEGYYPTPARPTLSEFTTMAVERFKELESGDGWVSVGAWLEALVKRDGMHPERSRRYLDEAQASGMVNRSTEGSTTDTRHDQHAIKVLRRAPSGVRIDIVHLYRGDFLIPNKSSSSLRIGSAQ